MLHGLFLYPHSSTLKSEICCFKRNMSMVVFWLYCSPSLNHNLNLGLFSLHSTTLLVVWNVHYSSSCFPYSYYRMLAEHLKFIHRVLDFSWISTCMLHSFTPVNIGATILTKLRKVNLTAGSPWDLSVVKYLACSQRKRKDVLLNGSPFSLEGLDWLVLVLCEAHV